MASSVATRAVGGDAWTSLDGGRHDRQGDVQGAHAPGPHQERVCTAPGNSTGGRDSFAARPGEVPQAPPRRLGGVEVIRRPRSNLTRPPCAAVFFADASAWQGSGRYGYRASTAPAVSEVTAAAVPHVHVTVPSV